MSSFASSWFASTLWSHMPKMVSDKVAGCALRFHHAAEMLDEFRRRFAGGSLGGIGSGLS